MKFYGFALAGGAAAALAGTALADFVGSRVDMLGGDGGDVTFKLYLLFDNEMDTMLAIGGNAEHSGLAFMTEDGSDLVQNCVLTNSILCDTKGPLDLGGDSWVNIGEETGDTAFSPNFLGGNGSESVIKGSAFSHPDNGGYFDSNPGTPVMPDQDDAILIAQFTINDTTLAHYQGTVSYVPGGADGFVNDVFDITFGVPAPGALALLGIAGLAGTRRRRA